jgi:phage-related protein
MTERRIIFYKESFLDFYKSQNFKVQEKIDYVLDLIRYEKHVPLKFLKQLIKTEDIYEIRVITTFVSIRILCFFDREDTVVLLNCFIKKTRKTPRGEILRAERIKREYESEKQGGICNG